VSDTLSYRTPVKLHMPGKPWHKAKGFLVRLNEGGAWTVYIRRWPAKAFKSNPKIGEHHHVGVMPSGFRVLPSRQGSK
jgi:hypothetical protein